MKLYFYWLLATFCACSLYAHNPGTQANHYHDISTDELKDMLYSGQTLMLVDARSKEYDNGVRLPNAIYLPHNSTEEEIKEVLKDKNATIIVYCTNKKCPASRKLADKLVGWGYTNIWKYSDGLDAWVAAGNKTVKG